MSVTIANNIGGFAGYPFSGTLKTQEAPYNANGFEYGWRAKHIPNIRGIAELPFWGALKTQESP